MRVFVPSSFDGTPLAAVLDWHGLGSNGDEQAALSGYEELADEQGFVVVHPTGVADTRSRHHLVAARRRPGRRA